jgi:ATP-dependent helicase/DNAse subunit B
MATTNAAEKRKHRRYDLSLDLEVKGRKRGQPIQTQTRDISARGLYFSFTEPLEVGSELNFELNLPPELSGGKDVRVRCRGRIVRVDTVKGSQQVGVASTIETYEFIRGGSK